jgi:protein TonB
MQAKKTERANLENKKSTFFLIGMAVVLGVLWWAFEFRVYDIREVVFEQTAVEEVAEEEVMNTQRNEPPPPPPPPQQTTVIEVVDDDLDIDDDIDIDIEADEEDVIDDAPIIEEDEGEVEEEEIFKFVEQQPTFTGGEEAMYDYLRKNITYPDMARELGLQGKVFVQFVVEKDGRITNVKVVRGVSEDCDAEAARVVKKMPKWQPGKQRGKAVRTQFTLPVNFVLQS